MGPIFQFPIASSTDLGTAKWSAGPTAALIYSQGPWFGGVLAYHLMSFAGARHRGSVNQTYIEPEVSYNFESGWYAQIDPPITYDWTAEMKNAWVLPAGADVGKAFNIGPQAMSLQIGAYDFVKHPEGGAGVDDSRVGHRPGSQILMVPRSNCGSGSINHRIVDADIFWRDAASAREDEMSFKFAAAVCGIAMGIALRSVAALADPSAAASPAAAAPVAGLLRFRRSIRKPTNF